MAALATILASIITALMTVLASVAALLIFGGRFAAAFAANLVARAATAPVTAGAPAAAAASAAPPPPSLSSLAALSGPSSQFSVHRARLDFIDSPAKVGRPCRVRFDWILFNGAHSYITYRSRLRAEGSDGSVPRELIEPPQTAPRGSSYQQRIVGGIEAAFTWDKPGIYEVRARVKASIEGTPFTYQFEVKRRVRVVVPKVAVEATPSPS